MQPPLVNKYRFWYEKPIVWIAVGVFTGTAFLAMPTVHRFYYQWTGARKVQRAADAFAKGDFQTAVLNARGALATNDKDLEALRIMAKMTASAGAPQALDFRRQIEAINPQDPENRLGLTEALLKFGTPTAATEALGRVPAAEQATVRYHDIAAGIALAQGDAAGFESHIEQAAALASANDNTYRLRLATLRLGAKDPEQRAKALATLDELKAKPATASLALRALLRDSMERGTADPTLDYANALASAPGASVADKLERLSVMDAFLTGGARSPFSALRVTKDSFYSRLGELQKEVATQPDGVARVVEWMNTHHLALQVQEWIVTIPNDMVARPPVAVPLAETYALTSDWAKLKGILSEASWGTLEAVRFAYLARACERLHDSQGATAAWKSALESAQSNQNSLEPLSRLVDGWGWNERKEEVLWKLAATRECPRWAADALWDLAFARRDSTALFKVSKLILQSEPKSVSARINFARMAFVCEQEETEAHPITEALYKERETDDTVVLTYAFSLFRRNRAADAVNVMARLPAPLLAEPGPAFYHGLFLTAAGRPDEAENYLRAARDLTLLPELEAFRAFLTPAFAARVLERDGKTREADAAWSTATAAAEERVGWLEMLAKTAVQWGWEDRAGAVLSKLAAKGRCPDWAIPKLWAQALKSGNDAEIYQAAKLTFDANPNAFEARNNFITVALFAGKTADLAHQEAEALHTGNLASADAAATFSLSLYRQGKLEPALAVLRGLAPEQLSQPRPARYEAFVLAALGRPEEAERALKAGATGPLLPEEKQLVETLQAAFQWHALQQNAGDSVAADAAWKQALSAAERRPEMLETLGRMLLKWDASEKADSVLWKLARTSGCPRWVIDQLWADAGKRRDAGQLYELSRLRRRATPDDLTFRNDFVRLSLLTEKDADFPHRQADALLEQNPGSPEVAATGALSLLQRNKTKEALAVLARLQPEQLNQPRVAFYYGLVLTANGQEAKAKEYLQTGSTTPLLPEEEKMLTKVSSASVARAVP